MKEVKGKVILTINDHPDMRKVFEGFRVKTEQIKYTVGGNDRGGKSTEMIVMNW